MNSHQSWGTTQKATQLFKGFQLENFLLHFLKDTMKLNKDGWDREAQNEISCRKLLNMICTLNFTSLFEIQRLSVLSRRTTLTFIEPLLSYFTFSEKVLHLKAVCSRKIGSRN